MLPHHHPYLQRKNKMKLRANEILIQVSVWDLVQHVNECCLPNSKMFEILRQIGVDIDLVQICNRYIDETSPGEGDVLIFGSSANQNSKVIFDLFRDPYDQLDLIVVGILCSDDDHASICKSLMNFFIECQTQVYFSISVGNATLRELAEPSNYPRLRPETGYMQKAVIKTS